MHVASSASLILTLHRLPPGSFQRILPVSAAGAAHRPRPACCQRPDRISRFVAAVFASSSTEQFLAIGGCSCALANACAQGARLRLRRRQDTVAQI
eukprot:6186690-Pleurochrysis_carterae.AAC.1